MRYSLSALSVLPFLGNLASAAVILPRQSTATSLYKFSPSLRAENIAVRPNGQLLITTIDAPDLWTVDPTTKKGSKLLTFPNTLSSAGITELTPDVYAVVTGNLTSSFANKGGWEIWKVDLTDSTPKTSVLKVFSDAGMFNGLTSLDNNTLLIPDATKGTVIKLTVSTLDSSVAIKDASMLPPSGSTGFSMGIDGCRYNSGFLWWTNIFKNTFSKVAMDATGKATGTVTQVFSDSGSNPDDFCFSADGTPYVALGKGSLAKFDDKGKMSTVASVASATACAFGRGEKDKNTVYVTSSGGSVFAVALS
ncbi:hypothetical protein G7Y89_g1778 [Cudoniella acicularis]|uniref:SMP-30/Gluconolactonase/LRE-like region domain-containing protein n=1 Tax=Cudoniella acicularis TaxID=354080 RepID=A0A8H4RUJ7_9HELO|nr:hypothetical protein G7Y89_g1778 [Cudoniella acicularis]